MFGREGAVFLVNSRVGLRKLACWNGHHIIDAFFRSVKRGFFAPLVMSDDGGGVYGIRHFQGCYITGSGK